MTQLERHTTAGNPVEIGFEIEKLVKEGWEIDPDAPLTVAAYGNLECSFIRDPANAKDAPPKKTRAEILAIARAAKAQKAAEKEGTTDE